MSAFQLMNNDLECTPRCDRPSQAEIDDLCMVLFDKWCERRCVLPLAYLMRSWPMPSRTFHVLRRLLKTLRDLETFHADTLASEERRLLVELVELTNQTLRTPSQS